MSEPIATTPLPGGGATPPPRGGGTMPVLGLGTWRMGEDRRRHDAEVAALRLGLDLGTTLIDTAEMYGDGGAERVVAEAIAGRRDEVMIVSKVMPHNASRRGTVAACEASLKRLGTDRIDVYLLHWRGRHPLADTVAAFEELVAAGKILRWGVSNFDVDDMEELLGLPGGAAVATNQVLYNLSSRGIEYDLVPWCGSRGVPIMAYSPIEQGALLDDPTVAGIARWHGVTPAEVALAWVMRLPGVVAIPKASMPEHVRRNRASADLRLDAQDLAALDRAFPPPRGPSALEMI